MAKPEFKLTQQELNNLLEMTREGERVQFFNALNDVANSLTDAGLEMEQFAPMVKLMAYIYRGLNTRPALYAMHHKDKTMVYSFKVLEIVYALQCDKIPLDWKRIFELADEYADSNFDDIKLDKENHA